MVLAAEGKQGTQGTSTAVAMDAMWESHRKDVPCSDLFDAARLLRVEGKHDRVLYMTAHVFLLAIARYVATASLLARAILNLRSFRWLRLWSAQRSQGGHATSFSALRTLACDVCGLLGLFLSLLCKHCHCMLSLSPGTICTDSGWIIMDPVPGMCPLIFGFHTCKRYPSIIVMYL